MSRGRIAAIIAVVIVVMIGWYVGVLSPKNKQLKDERARLRDARANEQSLNATLKRLQDLARQRPARKAELDRLANAIPPQADLAGFIISADQMAIDSGVDWVSVSPAPPAAGTGGAPSTISMSIQIQGGFFQVLDYLNRLEHLERIVVVDSVQLTAGAGAGVSPPLTVALTARMFTTAAARGATGVTTTTTTAPGGATNTTVSVTTAPGAGG